MYFAIVALLMFVLPFGSAAIGHLLQDGAPIMGLVGNWYVFWAAGVRLLLAGLRQYFQPRYTASEIFGVKSDDALPIVQELGISNFALGTAGALSLLRPDFVLPVAVAAAIFYGLAGYRHTMRGGRNFTENTAMASDLFACLVLAAFAVFALAS